jgi:hypothetical protein
MIFVPPNEKRYFSTKSNRINERDFFNDDIDKYFLSPLLTASLSLVFWRSFIKDHTRPIHTLTKQCSACLLMNFFISFHISNIYIRWCQNCPYIEKNAHCFNRFLPMTGSLWDEAYFAACALSELSPKWNFFFLFSYLMVDNRYAFDFYLIPYLFFLSKS